jgi:hypothetical protein
MRKLIALALLALGSTACNGNILGYDQRQLLSEPSKAYTGIPSTWYLYQEGMNFGDWLKGLDFYGGGTFAGTPVIELASGNAPYSGTQCLHFGIGAQSGGWWCGMILLQGSGFAASNGAPGVDLSAANFTKCVFMARVATGSSAVNFQAFNDGANSINATVTTAWQQFTVPLNNPVNIATMRQFFVIGLSSGMGTTTPFDLYIDDLRYEP